MMPSTPAVFCTRYFIHNMLEDRDMGWFYGFADKASCDLFKDTVEGRGTFRHSVCCSTPKCNAPDKSLDPARTIVPTPKRA
jgi:hypothetical protein